MGGRTEPLAPFATAAKDPSRMLRVGDVSEKDPIEDSFSGKEPR